MKKPLFLSALFSLLVGGTVTSATTDAEAGISVNWDKLCINAGGFVTDEEGPNVKPMMNGLGCDLSARAKKCPAGKALSMQTLQCSIDQRAACEEAGGTFRKEGYFSAQLNGGVCAYPAYPCGSIGNDGERHDAPGSRVVESQYLYTAPSGEQFSLKKYTCEMVSACPDYKEPVSWSEWQKFDFSQQPFCESKSGTFGPAPGKPSASGGTGNASGGSKTSVEHAQDECIIKAMKTGQNYMWNEYFGCQVQPKQDIPTPQQVSEGFGCEVTNSCHSGSSFRDWDPYIKSTTWVSMGPSCTTPNSPGCFK